MKALLPAALSVLVVTTPVFADEVTDTLDAIRKAYDEGNISKALEELSFAQAQMQAMKADSFAQFLPEAPEGWEREISTEMSGPMMFAGGGTGAEATYRKDDESFTISLMADSPLIGMMSGLLSNPMVAMASGGKVHRVGDMKVLSQDGSLSALVGSNILVQAEGAAEDVMMPVVETIDFAALEDFKP
ncbi:hypothetical protein [Qingshengfaniella alkalisoli]|uniref:Uncharacterized protein n=1 Tax=Qingshengfaniella alkalisoli TaxID=2599296 RepID=A0A5B8IW39_9RHOB|nr:hypothetical protein [Qingshengfaniella alkalisoli]QDY69713.1 hypothetical protein FPZ52_08820 [Qingshengfaniella alkalisoli]